VAIQDQLPKSRITLTYRTTINGEPETVKLPVRLLILGDFSHNSSVDRWKRAEPVLAKNEDDELVPDYVKDTNPDGTPKVDANGQPVYKLDASGNKIPLKVDKERDLGERALRSITGNNINSVMKDMDIRLSLTGVKDWISSQGGTIDIKDMPISGMKSFHPDEIVKKVPKLNGLRLLRKLLEEMQANIDNRKGLRTKIREIYEKAERESLVAAIEGGQAGTFKGLQLPADTTTSGTTTPATTTPATTTPATTTPATTTPATTTPATTTPATTTSGGTANTQLLTDVFGTVDLKPPPETVKKPLIGTDYVEVKVELADEKLSEANRLASSLAALLQNVEGVKISKANEPPKYRFDKGQVAKAIERADELINLQMNEILHHPEFQRLEATWRGLEDLVENTNFKADITIDILDVDKEELRQDFENNSSDIFSGELFEKVYIKEYDQYGGRPFGTMIGLYEFDSTKQDLDWLQRMGKLANAAHCPFVTAASHKFFDGSYAGAQAVEAIKDLDGHLAHPKFSKWNKLRDTEEGAYLGLTFPRYALRLPWHPEKNPCGDLAAFEEDTRQDTKRAMLARYDEADLLEIQKLDKEGFSSPDDPRKKADKDVRPVDPSKYLWGNSAILFARNLVKAFEIAGWCQAIRGPKGGGLITGLPVDTFPLRGQEEIMPPVEIAIPDYREYEFARNGFIPLVYRKSSGDACFFSTQAIKVSKKFKDPKDSENSQLVTNLAYTFSITRLAHYIKCIMRDNIGSTADDVYIQQQLESWLAGYVTTVANPDDLTVRRFPFKATTVEVVSKPGEIGWYDCKVAVLPHIQFEGLNVTLMLESRLGSAK
jgi:type VI secretion system protein ImpC